MPHFDPECRLRTYGCFFLVYTCKDALAVKSDNSHVVERGSIKTAEKDLSETVVAYVPLVQLYLVVLSATELWQRWRLWPPSFLHLFGHKMDLAVNSTVFYCSP